jgi:hypothetical protein
MKAKLIKDSDGYWLDISDDGITKRPLTDFGQLSLKNCQAIENGYDLDELANRAFDNMGYHSTVTPHEEKQFKLGYRVAFREALELLGDKKFSEADMVKFGKKCFYKGFDKSENDDANCYTAFREEISGLIQSLQQTEFEVEICCYIGNGDKESDSFKDPLVTNTGIPKLDEDGCLILRRK